jgi:hypothetical protein
VKDLQPNYILLHGIRAANLSHNHDARRNRSEGKKNSTSVLLSLIAMSLSSEPKLPPKENPLNHHPRRAPPPMQPLSNSMFLLP